MHNFLECLVKETRIAGYQFKKEKQKVIIFLSYDLVQKTPLIPKVTLFFSPGRTQISSVKALQDFNRQNPTALTFIGTKEGVMTLKDCLQRKCGGQILVTTT
jgi:ribosomal protein S8